MNCIFCDIATGHSPAAVEYEDEQIIAFQDINPAAPVHILIIPKKHIASVAEANEVDIALFGRLIFIAKKLANERHLKGYKLIFNVGKDGGQVVFHVHLHLIGGWGKPAKAV